MGLMLSYIHRVLLRRGALDYLLPDSSDLDHDWPDREAARAEIEGRIEDEEVVRREVEVAIAKLKELDKKNHYGESLRRAFGGR